jgi:FHS family L-fucose permease-like MFS transporter
MLFFAWGFICANNDPLIAALRRIFQLSYTEALFTHIVFFAAFGIVSLPAGALLARLGPVRTILAALAAMIAGCMAIQLTAFVPLFPIVLAGLFVLAAGIVTLQVAANPLAAALGPPGRSHFRLTLAQSFNSLGVVAGAYFGTRVLLGDEVFRATGQIVDQAARDAGLSAVRNAFLAIALFVLLFAAALWAARKPIEAGAPASAESPRLFGAIRSRWALAGAAAIALYVGAEVSIGSMMINFLASADTLGLPLATAGFYLANFYWGGALVGRFIGSALLARLAAAQLLAGAAAAAAILCATAVLVPGPAAGWCALSVGLFNSIMFPTIFSLTLERSSAPASATSGLLCVAVSGGAVVPMLTGQLADRAGLAWMPAVPLLAYLAVFGFAVACLIDWDRAWARRPAT